MGTRGYGGGKGKKMRKRNKRVGVGGQEDTVAEKGRRRGIKRMRRMVWRARG